MEEQEEELEEQEEQEKRWFAGRGDAAALYASRARRRTGDVGETVSRTGHALREEAIAGKQEGWDLFFFLPLENRSSSGPAFRGWAHQMAVTRPPTPVRDDAHASKAKVKQWLAGRGLGAWSNGPERPESIV